VKIFLVILLLLESAYFLWTETTSIEVSLQAVGNPALANVLHNARVAQVSDFHFSGDSRRAQKLEATLLRLNPDIILVTGDLISDNGGIDTCAQLLGRLARHKIVITALGNNDHPYGSKVIDTRLLVDSLRRNGVYVLVNQAAIINIDGAPAPLYVVGLDDNFLMLDDYFAAMENVPPDATKILLAHAPNIVEKINTRYFSLVLCGHTHGGQLIVPFAGAIYTNPTFKAKRKFVSGLYDGKLYVNRGIGTAIIPLRLFCRPEITLFPICGEGCQEILKDESQGGEQE